MVGGREWWRDKGRWDGNGVGNGVGNGGMVGNAVEGGVNEVEEWWVEGNGGGVSNRDGREKNKRHKCVSF